MADSTYPILSVCATVGSRLADLSIIDGQMIFVQDKHRVALDYNGKRVFYNQIEELSTEQARLSLLAPVAGLYYFVIETAVLWTYRNEWVQITTPPREVFFIGVELPELGVKKTLYINTKRKQISIWDDETSSYIVVADETQEISADDIDAMFNE